MEVGGQLRALATLPSKEKTPGTHYTGGWVGPRTGLDVTEKKKSLVRAGT
jgi:hypothetical protein